nr:MAG TPA: hypothetical protein [Caudoviricetes sp.]
MFPFRSTVWNELIIAKGRSASEATQYNLSLECEGKTKK